MWRYLITKNHSKLMKRLSKSRYTLFSQCPKAVWLRTYKPEMAEVDEALQARFEKGNEVGDLAIRLSSMSMEDIWGVRKRTLFILPRN